MKLAVLGGLICAAAAATAGLSLLLGLPEQAAPSGAIPAPAHLIARDSSGHGHHGINQGHPRMGLPGHTGTSYSFDKAGSWIEVPSADDLNPGHRSFTITVWVRLNTLPVHHSDYDIVRKGLSSTSEYKIEVMRGGAVRCTAKDTAGRRARITGWPHPLTARRWHLIGCSRASSTWTVHADGWSESKRFRLGTIANSMPLSIGSNYGLEDAPQGQIDDVRLRKNGHTVGLWHLNETSPQTR